MAYSCISGTVPLYDHVKRVLPFTPGVCNDSQSDDETLMTVVDAGLDMVLPYPPLLRKQRAVDLFLSFDFTSRDCDSDITVPFKVKHAHAQTYPYIIGASHLL